jgi:hypothetical protein
MKHIRPIYPATIRDVTSTHGSSERPVWRGLHPHDAPLRPSLSRVFNRPVPSIDPRIPLNTRNLFLTQKPTASSKATNARIHSSDDRQRQYGRPGSGFIGRFAPSASRHLSTSPRQRERYQEAPYHTASDHAKRYNTRLTPLIRRSVVTKVRDISYVVLGCRAVPLSRVHRGRT